MAGARRGCKRDRCACSLAGADWLDQASAEALQFAARRLEAEGVAFVFTARTSEGARLDARGLEEIELAGLEAVGGA